MFLVKIKRINIINYILTLAHERDSDPYYNGACLYLSVEAKY